MGYSTSFELKWEPMPGFVPPDDPVVAAIKEKLGDMAEIALGRIKPATFSLDDLVAHRIKNDEYASYALNEDGSTEDSCKWYEHDQFMLPLSADVPNVLFTLHGEGEENGDIWNKYYLNGKMQEARAKIQIAPFDPKGDIK